VVFASWQPRNLFLHRDCGGGVGNFYADDGGDCIRCRGGQIKNDAGTGLLNFKLLRSASRYARVTEQRERGGAEQGQQDN